MEHHPRFLRRITGGRASDIVGFGDQGVWVALNSGRGVFQAPELVEPFFGYPAGWRAEDHPRLVDYINGDLSADIAAFGNSGVWVSLSNRDGTFRPPQLVVKNLGCNDGWRVDRHPRILGKLTQGHLGRDIVGFGNSGVWVALNNKDGTFEAPQLVVRELGYNNGWRVNENPRYCADITGNLLDDIVGFVTAASGSRPTSNCDNRKRPLGSVL